MEIKDIPWTSSNQLLHQKLLKFRVCIILRKDRTRKDLGEEYCMYSSRRGHLQQLLDVSLGQSYEKSELLTEALSSSNPFLSLSMQFLYPCICIDTIIIIIITMTCGEENNIEKFLFDTDSSTSFLKTKRTLPKYYINLKLVKNISHIMCMWRLWRKTFDFLWVQLVSTLRPKI